MIEDIRIKVGFFTHYKTTRLIKRAGFEGAFRLLHLFEWAAVNRPDGDFAGMTGEDVEDSVGWRGEPGLFINSLCALGFMDGPERAYSIHDWAEHNPWVAGRQERSEAAKWASLCKNYGRDGAAERMPDYAERLRAASDPEADRSDPEAGRLNPHLRVSDNRLSPVSVSVSASNSVSASDSVSASATDSPPGAVAASRRGNARTRTGARALAPTRAPPPTGPTWNSYSAAYEDRYSIGPVRNAKSNSLLKQLIDRIGAEDAPHVAEFYVRHNSAFYIQRGHNLQCLVADAEKLRMEWATKRNITGTKARREEQTHDRGDVWAGLRKGDEQP